MATRPRRGASCAGARCAARRHPSACATRGGGRDPGALVVERNVLEWRFDPTSDARLPVADYDRELVVFCSAGYTSSPVAASLQTLGLHRTTDLSGGFQAWRAAGLPTVRGGTPAEETSPLA